jgi:hypothetical protein
MNFDTMTLEQFKESTRLPNPPENMSDNLLAMWHDAKGDWDKAHSIAQSTGGQDGDWIHAYLHRKEGDLGNASYWYSRAGKQKPQMSLQEEWDHISGYLLAKM